MIKRVIVSNFKQFEQIELELSQSVVLIGPNNSGKTSLFQALCLWETGVRKYLEAKRLGGLNKSGGVTLSRQSLINTPVESAKLLWRNQQPSQNQHVPLDITLTGETGGQEWRCKARFLYYNEESFTCRIVEGKDCLDALSEKGLVRFGFLQTMSGISSQEDKLTPGSIARNMGEGKTAEVIRNLCYNMLYPEQNSLDFNDADTRWERLTGLMRQLFGVELDKPVYVRETGIIDLAYEYGGHRYPISSAGRGFQQTLLLLTYILSNRNTVLLIDEPDAHLEIVRQREIFGLINHFARENDSQVLIASHSEVVLTSAVESDAVVTALIEGKAYPVIGQHDISAIRDALAQYGWDKYAAARMYGHILFLEGETDLKMLAAFATVLNHPAKDLLPKANVQYVNGNNPNSARHAFEAFKHFFPELKGLAMFDRLQQIPKSSELKIISLKKREIENYFAAPGTLVRYAESLEAAQGVSKDALRRWMEEAIADNTTPARLKNLEDSWWDDEKLTDNWLNLIFPEFTEKLPKKSGYQNYKTNYYQLVSFVKPEEVDKELRQVLDEVFELLRPE